MGRNNRSRGRDISGILILDKPLEITSNTALQRVKRLFDANKAGHTGSLDRMASGLLPICLGEATKLSSFLLDANKQYIAEARLGIKTDTADAVGKIIEQRRIPAVTETLFTKTLEQFKGDIEQIPPMFSALKVNGQRLYRLAYDGKEVERKPRSITIHDLRLVSFTSNTFCIDVSCSKGTYIRTLVDDIGEVIGCGAHVTSLRRLRSGPFQASDMIPLCDLELKRAQGYHCVDDLIRKPDHAVMHLPEVILNDTTAHYVLQGQSVRSPGAPAEGLVRLYRREQFLGLGKILDDGSVAPKRLFKIHDEQ